MFVNTDRIKELLMGPLPGEKAQRTMMARPESPLRFASSARANARESGVLILLYPDKTGHRIPLILRHEYKGAHSGQVSLPGGRRESVDDSIIATALRETEEEIGVPTNDIHVLGRLTELFIPVSNHLVYPVVGQLNHSPQLIPEEREVREIVTAGIEELLAPETLKETSLDINGYRLHTPYYHLGNQIVWGATAMILSEFSAIIRLSSEK